MDQRKNNKAAKQMQLNKQSAPIMSKSAKRRRRARLAKSGGASGMYSSSTTYPNIQAKGVSPIGNKSVYNGSIAKSISSRSMKISDSGMNFLKCAFAPPDFATSNVRGVPDEFQGRSLIKKHRIVDSVAFNVASRDWYILLLPVPGYAYFRADVAAGTGITGTTVFTGFKYSDSTSIFGTLSGTADNVNKFRYVSNHIEIIPTVNQASWSGSISCFKFPASLILRPNTDTSTPGFNLYSITGLQSVNTTLADQYNGPFNLGVYSGAYNTGSNFNFNQIVEDVNNVPHTINFALGDYGQLNCSPFTGFDNQFDCVCLKFSGMGSNINNSCILKTWACVEYQVVANSNLYEYQSVSPYDPVALDLYRKIINELPVGVSFVDNDGFWQRVLRIIKQLSAGASILPGPYGMAAGGVNTIANALEQILL